MSFKARLSLISALLCFAAFFANVGIAAFGGGVILGDIPEMLLLLLSATLFVIGTLACEAETNLSDSGEP